MEDSSQRITRRKIKALIHEAWDVGREDALDGKNRDPAFMIPKEPSPEALVTRIAYIQGYANGEKLKAILDEEKL